MRVPELDGRTRKMPKVPTAETGDDSLMTALSELSSLESDSLHETVDRTASATDVVKPQAENHFGEQVALAPPGHSVHVTLPQEIPQGLEAIDTLENVDAPIALSDSLAALASIDEDPDLGPATGEISEELLRDMRTASRGSAWFSLSSVLLFGMALLIGATGGWWLTKSGIIGVNGPPSGVDSMPKNDRRAETNPEAMPVSIDATERVLQGTIQYQNATGHLLPDARAMVLLLPETRIGTLLLDARSLHKPLSDPDRKATLSALGAFGAKITRANDEGLYAIACTDPEGYRMVVVSQHSERQVDVPVQTEVSELLRSYFQSPGRVCGHLAVQVANVDTSTGGLDFRFDSNQ